MLKNIITIILLFLLFNGTAQRSSRGIDVFTEIKSIPAWYTKDYDPANNIRDYNNVDPTFNKIKKLGSKAIKALMMSLSDTTATTIINSCEGSYLTKGQLAYILINEIERVPLFIVTKTQWDVFGNCSILPNGFLSYLKKDAIAFKEQYIVYFNSKER